MNVVLSQRPMALSKTHNTITLVDVAREAGVSLKTASRVLNESSEVREGTQAKVRAAMSRLGYRPNELARGLKARKSVAIGMIMKNLSDPFAASATKAAQEVARANGYVLILASSGGHADLERSEIESLIGRQVDGLLISPLGNPRSNFTDIIPPGLPVVILDQPVQDGDFDSVMINNRLSSKGAVQHLLRHGYRRIVAVAIRPYLHTNSERIAGYREAMKAAKFEPRICIVESEGLLTAQWLSENLFYRHSPEAIICMNWVCTVVTLRGMKQLGKKPGRGIAFVSFDDFELAGLLKPSLTAVRQPAAALGAQAANLLFDRINGKKKIKRRSLVLPTELILRESCGCDRPL